MNNSLFRFVPLAALCGLVAFVLSLPLIFLLHRALGLGSPPVSGLVLLGAAVVVSFFLAAISGAIVGLSKGNIWLAAVLGFTIGCAICLIVVPFYGGLIVQGLTGDASSLIWNERGQVESAARGVALDRANETLRAVRKGRVGQQLESYRKEAREATTPEARAVALKSATDLSQVLVKSASSKAVILLKTGAIRLSAFGLLLWAIVGSPLVAAFSCQRTRF